MVVISVDIMLLIMEYNVSYDIILLWFAIVLKLYLELVSPRETLLCDARGVCVSRAATAVTNASKRLHVFDLPYRCSNIVMCALYVLN